MKELILKVLVKRTINEFEASKHIQVNGYYSVELNQRFHHIAYLPSKMDEVAVLKEVLKWLEQDLKREGLLLVWWDVLNIEGERELEEVST